MQNTHRPSKRVLKIVQGMGAVAWLVVMLTLVLFNPQIGPLYSKPSPTPIPPSFCPSLQGINDPTTFPRDWHTGETMVFHWTSESCDGWPPAGIAVTFNARLYGPFASVDAANAIANADEGTETTIYASMSGIPVVAAAPAIQSDTSMDSDHFLALYLPESLAPGVYRCVAYSEMNPPNYPVPLDEGISFTVVISAP